MTTNSVKRQDYIPIQLFYGRKKTHAAYAPIIGNILCRITFVNKQAHYSNEVVTTVIPYKTGINKGLPRALITNPIIELDSNTVIYDANKTVKITKSPTCCKWYYLGHNNLCAIGFNKYYVAEKDL